MGAVGPGHDARVDSIVQRYSRRRQQRQRRDRCGLGECAGTACECAPFLLSPLLLLRVVPGAFRADAVDPWTTRPDGRLARGGTRLVRSYQLHVSVPRARPVCPMTPTCSRYGLQALSRHGAWRGGRLVLRRLRRCGRATAYDPVPPTP